MAAEGDNLKTLMEDPEFKAKWRANADEQELMHQIVKDISKLDIPLTDFAKKCDISLRALNKVFLDPEKATLGSLEKIANGLGKKLEIKFV